MTETTIKINTEKNAHRFRFVDLDVTSNPMNHSIAPPPRRSRIAKFSSSIGRFGSDTFAIPCQIRAVIPGKVHRRIGRSPINFALSEPARLFDVAEKRIVDDLRFIPRPEASS